jgi:hypothetical protein
VGPRQHRRVHVAQGTAGGEPHPVGTGLPAQDLGHLRLQPVRHPRLQPESVPERLGQRRGHDLGVVAQDVGHVTLPEIKNLVAVLVGEPAPSRGYDPRWKRLHETKGVAATVNEVLARLPVHGGRTWAALRVLLGQFGQ